MMKPKCFLTVLLLSSIVVLGSNPLEDEYFTKRDGYFEQFRGVEASPEADKEVDLALDELEKILRIIIGPINFPGIPENSRINLETLLYEPAFDQVDGLSYYDVYETLFVTTKSLLSNYISRFANLPSNPADLSENEDFYSKVFAWNVSYTLYVELPVQGSNNASLARAFLFLAHQDIGPFLPDQIIAFVEHGDYILICSVSVESTIAQVQSCLAEWEERYNSSMGAEDEDKAFDEYVRCFAEHAKSNSSLAFITKQAQKIVNRLTQAKTD